MMKNSASLKGSFNYRSCQLKQALKEKAALEGKTITVVLNELIEAYIQGKVSFSQDETLKNIVIKLLLLISADEPNLIVIKKEIERLWELIQ